jgi:dihydrofolate reductase
MENKEKMQQRKVILYIASSLDGFIATKNHNLEWLFSVEGDNDNGYSKFYDTIDTILLGRTTYEWILEHEKNKFPYIDKECYVFSKEERTNTEYVTFVQNDVINFINNLKNKNGKDIWLVGGSVLINTLLSEKIIDELIITVAPVLIGQGIPLFNINNFNIKLDLNYIKRYNQFVELSYKIVNYVKG